MIAAKGCDKFGFAVALKTRARNYIERAVGAVAIFCGKAAALDFDHVNVLGIELRADVGGNVCVRYGNAVYKPGDLVTAANVKLVVNHVRAGCVAGDEV